LWARFKTGTRLFDITFVVPEGENSSVEKSIGESDPMSRDFFSYENWVDGCARRTPLIDEEAIEDKNGFEAKTGSDSYDGLPG